jgi:hypothetical protein
LFHKNSDQRGTKKGILKLSRNEEKRMDLFQKNSDRRATNIFIPKLFSDEVRRTDFFPKSSNQRKTNHLDSDLEDKIWKKTKIRLFFNEGKVFDPKKSEVLTLLAIFQIYQPVGLCIPHRYKSPQKTRP